MTTHVSISYYEVLTKVMQETTRTIREPKDIHDMNHVSLHQS